MTNDNGASSPASAAADADGAAGADQQPTVIIRDKRKVDPAGKPKPGMTGRAAASASASAGGGQPATSSVHADSSGGGSAGAAGAASGADASGAPSESTSAAATPGAQAASTAGQASATADPTDGPATDADSTGSGEAAAAATDADSESAVTAGPATAPPTGIGAEMAALRADLDERTRDLQRLSAEYANYRKRVERDRGVVAEQATGVVLASLLPVLDDLDRARDHGDLVGPFGSVAEQLNAALAKFGLTAFGAKGDPFDPTRHEAVAHTTSAEVSESTCVDVMRRGYLLGERLLRPALVAVADPE